MSEAQDDPDVITITDHWDSAGITNLRIASIAPDGARVTIRVGQHSTAGATIPPHRIAEVCALLASMLPPLERNALAVQIEPGEF